MPHFSTHSEYELGTCDRRLIHIARAVIPHADFRVIDGHRDKEAQDRAFWAGNSKKRFPDSKHNLFPSLAMDLAPYPIDWKDFERFALLAGRVLQTADTMKIKLRWGGDWDDDTHTTDETFRDYGHFEIVTDDDEIEKLFREAGEVVSPQG